MKIRRMLVVLTSLALLLSALASSTIAAKPTTSVGTQTTQSVTSLGSTQIAANAAKPTEANALEGEVRPDPEEVSEAELGPLIHNGGGGSHVPAANVPQPTPQTVIDAPGAFDVDGLSHFDQRFAGTGAYTNTQFSLEPPDQGLCVGNGYVLETVNTAIRVKNTSGANLTGVMPINDFFNLAPEIVRPAGPYGDFSTDPKCYFDDAANRWFITVLQIDVDSATGAFLPGSHLLIAVSKTGNPTGQFNLFSIDVTNDGTDGTPSHSQCPCFGDQPLIGADANGFYVTTNEFPIFVPGFNGANVYAFSKTALARGSIGTVTSFYVPTLAEGQAYSLQPATTPPGAAFATANGGTEFLLSALEFTGGLDNRIAVWSLTNTSSLGGRTPALQLQVAVLASEVYGVPPVMSQKDGSTPLKELLKIPDGAAILGVGPSGQQLNLLNSNDDRMNQTVYVNGTVWGALNTVVKSPTGGTQSGIAWFAVAPSFSGGVLGGAVSSQGYVSIANNNVAFPAVAANAAGKVIVAFSLVGPDYFPSTAYATLSPSAGNVNVVKWGEGPADGFTGYTSLDPGDGGVERWGDYSAATADEAGNLWFATESINQSCTFNEFLADFNCGGTRTILANWGTTIARIAP